MPPSVIRGQYFLHLNRKFIYEGLFRYPGGKARRLAVGRKPCFRFGTDCFDVNLEGDRRSSSREEVFTLTANRPLVFVLRSHKHSHPLNGVERGLKDFVVGVLVNLGGLPVGHGWPRSAGFGRGNRVPAKN